MPFRRILTPMVNGIQIIEEARDEWPHSSESDSEDSEESYAARGMNCWNANRQSFFSENNFPIFDSMHKEHAFIHRYSKHMTNLVQAFEDHDYRLNMPLENYWKGVTILDDEEPTLWEVKSGMESRIESMVQLSQNGVRNLDLLKLTEHLYMRRQCLLKLEKIHRLNENRWKSEHEHPPENVLWQVDYPYFNGEKVVDGRGLPLERYKPRSMSRNDWACFTLNM
jgi:exonuclease VII small subunit